jgi:hypothetical protein
MPTKKVAKKRSGKVAKERCYHHVLISKLAKAFED